MNDPLLGSSLRKRASGRPPGRIRILVAVPDELDRKALVALLRTQPAFEIVGDVSTAAAAARLCVEQPHDVLLLDLSMAGTASGSAIVSILTVSPRTHILALAPHDPEGCWLLEARTRAGARERPTAAAHPPCLQVALVQGALGGIHRNAPLEDLFVAVRRVASGQTWLHSEALPDLARLDAVEDARALSIREREIALLVSDGRSNKEIGEALRIREATVKKHLSHIFRKVAVQDRLQLGLYVVCQPHLFWGN